MAGGPWGSLWEFLASDSRLHVLTPSPLWIGLGSWGLGSFLLLRLVSPKVLALIEVTSTERPRNSLGARASLPVECSCRAEAGSEQRDLTGGQRELLLPGTEQVLHVHSHHSAQFQALQERPESTPRAQLSPREGSGWETVSPGPWEEHDELEGGMLGYRLEGLSKQETKGICQLYCM